MHRHGQQAPAEAGAQHAQAGQKRIGGGGGGTRCAPSRRSIRPSTVRKQKIHLTENHEGILVFKNICLPSRCARAA